MCMCLYVAADEPLAEIPERNPPAPLSARPLRDREERVRGHFSKPHILFLGSHSGCSCGFQYGVGGNEDAEGRESVRELGAYLARSLKDAGPIELFACWDGDESEPVVDRRVVSIAEFTDPGDEFTLAERSLLTVMPFAM